MTVAKESISFSEAIANLISSAFDAFFHPVEPPFPFWRRLILALMGTITVPLNLAIKINFEAFQNPDVQFDSLITVFVAVMVAWVIASAELRQGPVRIYISGVILSTFGITMAKFATG